MTEPPIIEGFERHHRQKGDRASWEHIIYLTPEDHKWAEANPEEARKLGWSVSRYDNPADVPILIPKQIHKGDPKPRERAKKRRVWSIKVPKYEKDDKTATLEEDGAELLDEDIQELRELLKDERGWSDTVPAYFVLRAATQIALVVLREGEHE